MFLTGFNSNMMVCWGGFKSSVFDYIIITLKLILCKDQKGKNKVQIE